jgi:hypothetical protein
MQVIDITCNTNGNKPVFCSIVDGVRLESDSLSKMECLITNVYPQSKYNYEFSRDMKWFRVLIKQQGELYFYGGMEILDDDYVQQLSRAFYSSMFANTIRIYDIHGDVIGELTRADYKAGKFPAL